MKHIKRFSETQKVNEEIAGALMIGGFFLAMAAPAIIKTATAAWTKMMMEMNCFILVWYSSLRTI